MLSPVLVASGVFSAWMLGLSLPGLKRPGVFIHAGITALLSGLGFLLLERAGRDSLFPLFLCILFLMETGALQLHTRWAPGNSLMAFCFSLGGFGCFWPVCAGLPEMDPLIRAAAGLLILAAFWSLWFCLRSRFPGPDWQQWFEASPGDSARLRLRPGMMYAVSLISCAGCCLPFLMRPGRFRELLLLSLGAFLPLWFGVALLILMTYYRKERLTVLLEQQYRSETQAFMNVIRSQRHDYNFHVQTLAGLIAADKFEECRRYVRALEKDSQEMNVLMPIKDPAVSATLFSFRSLAVRAGITLHIDITYDLSQIATNVYETNKILANLLQNAIDEVSTHEDKSWGIRLSILKRGEFCVIRVSNKVLRLPTAQELGQLCTRGYTTKQGHEGVGLSSISLLARRYRGIVYAQLEEDILHMIVRIPINTAKKEGE